MSLLSEPARARLLALACAAGSIDWHDGPAARARWARIERVVANLPRGDETDRELARAWAAEGDYGAWLEELELAGLPPRYGFGALDLLALPTFIDQEDA